MGRYLLALGAVLVNGVLTLDAVAQPVFTGNAPADLAADAPGVTVVVDPSGIDVGIPLGFPEGTISGNDLVDARVAYHGPSDTLFVALNTYGIAGDVDGDGDPGTASPRLAALGGTDFPDFGGVESFAILLDIDEDGTFDVIAGVDISTDLDGFGVFSFDGTPFAPAVSFGDPLPENSGVVFGSPSLRAPDLEFTIERFSTLPSSGRDSSATFGFNAFMGSLGDAGFGEDFVPGSNQTVSICPDADLAEICNDFDEDCDGAVDEDYDLGAICTVGVGFCESQGVKICAADGEGACSATPGEPRAERCNAIDDNCDGEIDEGTGGAACETGLLGVCSAGAQLCDEGVFECPPVTVASAEICNSLDDDCDGEADEGFELGLACVSGVGACGRDGVWICGDDGGRACDAAPGDAGLELCNGVDDDCDGVIDNGFGLGEACVAGVGRCERAGVNVCDGEGGVRCEAELGDPRAEICDGVDDDCDGLLDEGFDVGGACEVGVGACQVVGVTRCGEDEQVICIPDRVEIGTATDEICNGIDDDCDGEVDEDQGVGEPCTAGAGACEVSGVMICGDTGKAVCGATAKDASDEICDGVDNDCDGRIDNVLGLGEVCTNGLGVCVSQGELVCGDDDTAPVCDAVPGRRVAQFDCGGSAERRLDEDCDGLLDEDLGGADCDPVFGADGGVRTPRLTGADVVDNCSQSRSGGSLPWPLLLLLAAPVGRFRRRNRGASA